VIHESEIQAYDQDTRLFQGNAEAKKYTASWLCKDLVLLKLQIIQSVFFAPWIKVADSNK